MYTPRMNYAQLNGLRARYFVAGRGPEILFVHGWAASGRMWLRSQWALRRDFRAWAVDLPGFGGSDLPGEAWYALEAYTDYVAAFCAEAGIEGATVVGHSLGGRIVLDLALRHPHLVSSVVAVAPLITGRLGFNLDLFLLGRVGEALVSLSQHVWPLAEAGMMSQFIAPRHLTSESMKRASTDMRRASGDALVNSLRAVVGNDFSPHLAHIAQPALIISGERDLTVPPADARLAAERLPNAELAMLQGVHHMPSDEVPDLFLQLVRDFARRERAGEI